MRCHHRQTELASRRSFYVAESAEHGPTLAIRADAARRRPRGSTVRTTSESTGSRLIRASHGSKRQYFVGFPRIGRTITSSTWRRIPMDTARIIRAGCRLVLRGYGSADGVESGVIRRR